MTKIPKEMITFLDKETDNKNVTREKILTKTGDALGLYISINTSSYRISIYKNTLKAIGNPEFIQLGFNTESKQMMIMPADSKRKDKVHLYFTKAGSCFVFSKAMIDGIRIVSGVLSQKGSYLIKGIFLNQENVILFDLKKAVVPCLDEAD